MDRTERLGKGEGSGTRDYSPRPYLSWRQVAEYFDGDGAVYVSIMKFVLKIRLAFYDVWEPQLEGIKAFLEAKGIRTRRLALQRKGKVDLWNLTFGDPVQIRAISRKLLPYSCKKSGDLLVALNYLEDRLTGKDAIDKLNEFVKAKRRSGFVRNFDVSLTKSEGVRESRKRALEASKRAKTVEVLRSTTVEITRERVLGSALAELSSKNGYGLRVIRRVLRAKR